MQVFEALCPAGPEWSLSFDAVYAAFDWIRRLEGVAQDAVHHAEGDVLTHTRMAVSALVAAPAWQALPAADRVRLFAAVLLHDVAKPDCTQHTAEGRITAHGHSRRGDITARRLLWEAGASIADREHVAALVRHHQIPFWAAERDDLERVALRVSLVARNADLVALARADILGRICSDTDEVLASIALYEEFCASLGVLDQPWPFPSDHARFMYFRTPGRDPRYAAYDDTTSVVTIMSGLPASGKDTWVDAHADGRPVVSLDALRSQLGGDQGAVIAAAYEQARVLLRAKQPFIWNATNISRQQRDLIISLAANYHARIEIVAVESSPGRLRTRNQARPSPVPAAAIARMISKWEFPDKTEAHSLRVAGQS